MIEFIFCINLPRSLALKAKRLRLEQSVTPVDGKTAVTAPEHKSSRRTLCISDEGVELLKRVRAQQALQAPAHPER